MKAAWLVTASGNCSHKAPSHSMNNEEGDECSFLTHTRDPLLLVVAPGTPGIANRQRPCVSPGDGDLEPASSTEASPVRTRGCPGKAGGQHRPGRPWIKPSTLGNGHFL